MNEQELTKFVYELCDKHNLYRPVVVLNTRITKTIGLYKRYKNDKYSDELHVSKKFMVINNWDLDILTNIILHELAHQKTFDESKEHGTEFNQECRRLGIEGVSVINIPHKNIPKKYIATCSTCGNIYQKIRMPKTPRTCAVCSPIYDEKYKLNYIRNPEYSSK